MKKSIKYYLGLLSVAIFAIVFLGMMTSCKKDKEDDPGDGKGEAYISFKVNSVNVTGLKSTEGIKKMQLKSTPGQVHWASIWVREVGGSAQSVRAYVPVEIDSLTTEGTYVFTTQEITVPIGTGNWQLRTLTLDEVQMDDSPLYSAVQEGSALADFVTEWVPKDFTISAFAHDIITMDVVDYDDFTPDQFGYETVVINGISVQPIYFYGTDNAGVVSVMDMLLTIDGQPFEVTGEYATAQDVNGILKINYPDDLGKDNRTEFITFTLIKDGISFTKIYSVEELLVLPKKIHFLNVNAEDMKGFIPMSNTGLSFTLRFERTDAPGVFIPYLFNEFDVDNNMDLNIPHLQFSNIYVVGNHSNGVTGGILDTDYRMVARANEVPLSLERQYCNTIPIFDNLNIANNIERQEIVFYIRGYLRPLENILYPLLQYYSGNNGAFGGETTTITTEQLLSIAGTTITVPIEVDLLTGLIISVNGGLPVDIGGVDFPVEIF